MHGNEKCTHRFLTKYLNERFPWKPQCRKNKISTVLGVGYTLDSNGSRQGYIARIPRNF
jgi:hypothetical protein